MKFSLWGLGFLFVFSNCSTRGPASHSERSPASRGAPAVADVGHAARGTLQAPAEQTEMRAGCGPASLGRITVANGYTAEQILVGISTHGTFTAPQKIRTWRRNPLSHPNMNSWIVDYANALEYDRQVLAPWFKNSAADSQDSDIYQAAKDSQSFQNAVQFANSNGPLRVYWDQFDIGHRSAALLAVMFAAARSGDPGCVEYIDKEWVNKILPNEEAQSLFRQIRYREAAQLAQEGRVGRSFEEVYRNRQNLHAEIQSLDQAMKQREVQNKRELDRIQGELKESYFMLRSELLEIGPCRDYVSLNETIFAGQTQPQAFASDLVEKCKERLNTRLDSFRNDQLRLQADIKINEARIKQTEEAIALAKSRDNEREIQRREEALERLQTRHTTLVENLEQVGERAQLHSDYLNHLVQAESSSVMMELNRINALLSDREQRVSPDYMRGEQQKLNRLQGDLKTTSTSYLTLGFFGGFEEVGVARP
jgi:hypothetical protein